STHGRPFAPDTGSNDAIACHCSSVNSCLRTATQDQSRPPSPTLRTRPREGGGLSRPGAGGAGKRGLNLCGCCGTLRVPEWWLVTEPAYAGGANVGASEVVGTAEAGVQAGCERSRNRVRRSRGCDWGGGAARSDAQTTASGTAGAASVSRATSAG